MSNLVNAKSNQIVSFMDHIINTRKGYFGIAYFQVNIPEFST
jgi:hypothetical protein